MTRFGPPFAQVDGQPRQIIHDSLEPLWEEDVRRLPAEMRVNHELTCDGSSAAFRFERGPLLRILLIQVGDEVITCWSCTHHHFDQWSYGDHRP